MNSFGKNFRITLYGASHEQSMGVIIDGVPSGIKFNKALIDNDLLRRRPKALGTTSRVEKDAYEVKSGIYNGFTTGSAINIEILNNNINSEDYNNFKDHPRPSHADFVAIKKYKNFNDYRGGGVFSGRLTAAIVAAGSVAKMFTPFNFSSKIKQIGLEKNAKDFDKYLTKVIKNKDSVGGIVEVIIKNVPIGLGDPLFNKLDARLSYMLQSIPGVKGIYFGDNIEELVYGSKYNDLIINEEGLTKTNHAGGINGGISNGNDIIINIYVKPTPSIGIAQETFNIKTNKIETLKIKGRHDVAFVRRLPVILENACAVVLADFFLKKG